MSLCEEVPSDLPVCCANILMVDVAENDHAQGSATRLLQATSSPAVCFTSSYSAGNAFDLILVRCSQSGKISCSEIMFSFGSLSANNTPPRGFEVVLEVDISHPEHPSGETKGALRFKIGEDMTIRPSEDDRVAKSLMMREREDSGHDGEALNSLVTMLQNGRNSGRYLLLNESNCIVGTADVNVYLWSEHDHFAVVDIDGTITKSNVRGVVDTVLTQTYLHCHEGVCNLLSQLKGAQIIYLTSRPIVLAETTRNFLTNLRQTDHILPAGALIGFKGGWTQMLAMELLYKTSDKFKTEALHRNIVRPYKEIGVDVRFSAGFGNTLMDMEAYHSIGMDMRSLYLVDKKSRIYCLDGDVHTVKEMIDRHERYLLARGSTFNGYKDHRLLDHLLKSLSRCNSIRTGSSLLCVEDSTL